MAAPFCPVVALRGSKGIWMVNGPTDLNAPIDLVRDGSPDCKLMAFSDDGSLFAWSNGDGIRVVNCHRRITILSIERPRVIGLKFSPRGTLLASLEQYRVDGQTGLPNLHIYRVNTGELVQSFVQKKQSCWQPQWTKDEVVCARVVNNELQFYENNSFERYVHKLHIQKVSDFLLGPSISPYHVIVYVPGTKGQPSYIRLFTYPNFGGPNTALANRSFYKADKVSMHWNHRGTAVICVTTDETSDVTYYGDQGIFYVDVKGESMRVPLSKNGPVYCIEWNPCADQFCVVYGFMPAKASLFNMKCEEIFDFGIGPRNLVYYNAFGNHTDAVSQHGNMNNMRVLDQYISAVMRSFLCLCGFGNLRGNMEFWDVHQKQLIIQTKAEDTTHLSWCPDGETVITATTAPRLRMNNGYKFWHYSGSLLDAYTVPSGTELWEVLWQPVPPGTYSPPTVVPRAVSLSNHSQEKPAYRPPQARGNPVQTSTVRVIPGLHIAPDQSKNAEKNKKKRDAKKAKRKDGEMAPPHQPVGSGDNDATSTTSDADIEKRKRFISKKLKQIEKLKEDQRSGKSLDNNQMEKVRAEKSLLTELRSLSIS